jgi:hypothetical protein
MIVAAFVISCAAIGVNAYQLYWLRRLRAANRDLQCIRAERASAP